MTPSQEAIFRAAELRWEAIITGDVPDVFFEGRFIDDIEIDGSGVAIDGPGGVLGRAGPDVVRSGSFLPVHGIMEFDTADLASLEANGLLDEVILHEMAHVLGFGTIWNALGLLRGSSFFGSRRFIGPEATAQYNAIFGTSSSGVPVETCCGSGTRDSHWRESTFNHELMTGFIDSGFNPISAITVASMADLGYTVDISQADFYAPPGSAQSSSGGGVPGGSRSLRHDHDHDHDHDHVHIDPPAFSVIPVGLPAAEVEETFVFWPSDAGENLSLGGATTAASQAAPDAQIDSVLPPELEDVRAELHDEIELGELETDEPEESILDEIEDVDLFLAGRFA